MSIKCLIHKTKNLFIVDCWTSQEHGTVVRVSSNLFDMFDTSPNWGVVKYFFKVFDNWSEQVCRIKQAQVINFYAWDDGNKKIEDLNIDDFICVPVNINIKRSRKINKADRDVQPPSFQKIWSTLGLP